ncbi:Bcr/CflA family drug resistance efflux transporter, partial [Vibrio sp. 10N.222.48.A8]
FSTPQLMSLAILIILASGTWLLTHELSIFNLVWAFTWLAIAQGISFPLSISMLLEPHKKQAGAVSALSGSIQMCLAGLLG